MRLIDANVNRCTEGLRVCEDITRFILNDGRLTSSFKSIRHGVKGESKKILKLPKHRNVAEDVGKKTTTSERGRKNIKDVFLANACRAKESLRVLEEVSKLCDNKSSGKFKKLRFRTYELEKKSSVKLEAVLHNR